MKPSTVGFLIIVGLLVIAAGMSEPEPTQPQKPVASESRVAKWSFCRWRVHAICYAIKR